LIRHLTRKKLMTHPDRESAFISRKTSSSLALAQPAAWLRHSLFIATLIMVGCNNAPHLHADDRDASSSKPIVPDFWDEIPASPSTTIPDGIRDGYWHSQFQRVNQAVARADQSQVVFFGDSITLRWSMLKAEGKAVWEEQFAKYNPINMGNSGDITPVMLYRVTHGNLDFAPGQEPRVAVLLCGTNNYVVTQSDGGKVKWDLGIDTPPRDVAHGVRAVAQEFRRRLPNTRVILLGILPVKSQAKWIKCKETNWINASYRYPIDEVVFLDLQDHFLNADGSLKADLFVDGTHLSLSGYAVLAGELAPMIGRLMKLGPVGAPP
jgi:lysophospholipase L1-like esterase